MQHNNTAMGNHPEEKEKKTGIVPEEQISGSDADQAYNEAGEFGAASQEQDNDAKAADDQKGSDADADQ